MVTDISCLAKNLDLRVMLCAKRILIALNVSVFSLYISEILLFLLHFTVYSASINSSIFMSIPMFPVSNSSKDNH